MWLGAAIGGGILFLAVIIALIVSCVTAKRSVSVQKKKPKIFDKYSIKKNIIRSVLIDFYISQFGKAYERVNL